MLLTDKLQSLSRLEGLESVTSPVKGQLERLQVFMQAQVGQFEPEVRDLVNYCLRNGGKRIRPILLFYCGWPIKEHVEENLVKAASVIEFVHLATLVHDDILDGATLRHNHPTVSEKFGANVAVLVGDALFAQAMRLASDFPTVKICRAVSAATRRVCAGEIAQTFQSGNATISVEEYLHIVDCKTAELFSLSCLLGADLAGYSAGFAEAVEVFGRHLGIAYQIFDDLADFLGREERIGKTLGTDVAGGKYTLPLIVLLAKLTESERRTLVHDLRSVQNPDLADLNHRMEQNGVFPAVRDYFQSEIQKAEQAIEPYSEFSPTKFLLKISAFVTNRINSLVLD